MEQPSLAFQYSSPGGSTTAAKSAVYDCLVLTAMLWLFGLVVILLGSSKKLLYVEPG